MSRGGSQAVECGSSTSEASKLDSWHLWRFNPALIEEGKNPFSLDSKEPNWENFHDFLLGEVRYLSVKKAYPNETEELHSRASSPTRSLSPRPRRWPSCATRLTSASLRRIGRIKNWED